MKNLKNISLSCFLILSFFIASDAHARYLRKSESFAFLIDNSEGMHGKSDLFGKEKMLAVKALASRINQKIPDLGYTASMHLYSPTKKIIHYDIWNELLFANGIDSIESMSKFKAKNANLAGGIKDVSRMYHDMGSINVFLFIDGEQIQEEDFTMVNRLYGSHKGLCLHIISFAESPQAQANLDIIAKKNPCSVSMHAKDLLTYDNLTEKFIREVLVKDSNFLR